MFEPGTEAYLARIRAEVGDLPPPRSLDERRANFDRRCSVWRRPAPETLNVRDWHVPASGREIPIRLYRRKDVSAPPVLLYFHGGGWVNGSIDTHDSITWGIAEATGALVISVHYRRAPENPYPAAFDDCWEVLLWAARSGPWLEADAGRLGVSGDSAGGNLAAAIALMARDRNGPGLRLQGLLYPVTDTDIDRPSYRTAKDPLLTRDGMRFYLDAYLQGRLDTRDPLAMPIHAPSLAGLPPAYVMTAEHDPLRDEGEDYAARLQAAGVPTVLSRGAGTIHGFLRARFASPMAQDALLHLSAWIKQRLA